MAGHFSKTIKKQDGTVNKSYKPAAAKWYYYQELKEISLIAFIIVFVWVLYNYGTTIAKFIFTEKGLICLAFFFASMVIAITIKMYYRIMVIKYYEKDTGIELFKYLNEKN